MVKIWGFFSGCFIVASDQYAILFSEFWFLACKTDIIFYEWSIHWNSFVLYIIPVNISIQLFPLCYTSDSRFTQQELPACKAILTPGWYVFLIFCNWNLIYETWSFSFSALFWLSFALCCCFRWLQLLY